MFSQFLRRLLILQVTPVVIVTTFTEHFNSRKWKTSVTITYSSCNGYYS